MKPLVLDFASLAAALQDESNLRDHGKRAVMLKQFKGELAMLLIGLRAAQVIGTTDRPADPAETCDLCGADVAESALYVDGAVAHRGGMWANMCMTCFLVQGKGVGWGVGQLYSHDGVGWQCIGGGNPSPQDDDG